MKGKHRGFVIVPKQEIGDEKKSSVGRVSRAIFGA